MVKRIAAQAWLIVLDGFRSYALFGLFFFALSGIFSGLFFLEFIPRDIGRAANDFLFSIIWLTGFIFLLFHAVQVIAYDNKFGAVHVFLARPISRTEYCLGVFSGLTFLLLILNCLLGIIGWVSLTYIKGSVDTAYFHSLSIPFYVLTLMGLLWIELMFLAIIVLIGSAVQGRFPVLLLTLCYYFICSGLPVVRDASAPTVENGTGLYYCILKWLNALFPDFSRLDFKTFVSSPESVTNIIQLVQLFSQSALYVIIVLWVASFIYERRDLK